MSASSSQNPKSDPDPDSGSDSNTDGGRPFRGDVVRTPDFVSDAVAFIASRADEACRARGAFWLSLCGGGTPRPIYEALASRSDFPWQKTWITFGDERCVPADHERSNYRMARECLLDHVAIPSGQVLRMEGEQPPAEAARSYEDRLKAQAAVQNEPIFAHDLILLGMGEDGHTASLFPGTTALQERERWVVANEVPQMGETRLTFTYPLINAAHHVCFLVSGEGKRSLCESIFEGNREFPAARVSPAPGRLTWIVG